MVVNNASKIDAFREPIRLKLVDKYKNVEDVEALINNVFYLFYFRKMLKALTTYLRNVNTYHLSSLDITQDAMTPAEFVHELVAKDTVIYICNILNRNTNGYGSIFKLARANWVKGENLSDKALTPFKDTGDLNRVFELRNKLIAHIDLSLSDIMSYRDIENILNIHDNFIVPSCDILFQEFLNSTMYLELGPSDRTLETYRLIYS